MQGITKTIRELDPELYTLARAEAVKEGRTIGAWLNEAIREKLGKTNKQKGGK